MNQKLNVNNPEFSISLINFFINNSIGPFHHKEIQELDSGRTVIQFCETDEKTDNKLYICSKCSIKHFDRKASQVNYNCPQRNSIYAIRSMICHATEISTILNGKLFSYLNIPFEKYSFIDSFFINKTEVNIASIGYASGTDLLAILRYFSDKPFRIQKLNILRIDTNADKWQETADLTEQFVRENADLSFDFEIKTFTDDFQTKDVNIDIFILSYVLNELNENQIDNLIETIQLLSNQKFILLINDVNKYNFDDSKYYKYSIDKLENKCNTINSYSNYYPYELDINQYGKYYRKYDCSCKYKELISTEIREYFAIKLYLQSKFYIAEFEK